MKGPLWIMASRMKYSTTTMPLMRKNGRKGLRCFKHCLAETPMKHQESGTDLSCLACVSCQHILPGSSREVGLFREREILRAERAK